MGRGQVCIFVCWEPRLVWFGWLCGSLGRHFGHRLLKGKSCVIQLVEYLEDITEDLANGEDVDAIYLDFCKVFDKTVKDIRKIWNKRKITQLDKILLVI